MESVTQSKHKQRFQVCACVRTRLCEQNTLFYYFFKKPEGHRSSLQGFYELQWDNAMVPRWRTRQVER